MRNVIRKRSHNMETRNCQNCKKDFTIESEDFDFYSKIKVPPPTFCPDCRRQRRLAFRNTHSLYRRKDSFTGKDILSIYSPDKDVVVIDQKDWWGDGWDPMDYGFEYDFSKTFFSQWKKLRDSIPLQSLSNSKAVNSEYCNVAEENYDCYLITACYQNERVMYSDSISNDKDSMDLHVTHRSEFCYDDVNCTDSYKLFYSVDSHTCTDSYFLYDCKGCTSCFMCTNLRNKSYCFENEQLSKEEYDEKIHKYNLGNRNTIEKLKEQFTDLKLKSIHRFARIVNSYNVSGDNIDHAKNSHFCFDTTQGPEDSKFLFWGGMKTKDCYDTDACAELESSYESFDLGVGGNRNLFSNVVYSSNEIEYSINCYNSSNLFGCIGLRNKKYCILNKQYEKGEYFEKLSKIKQQMMDITYTDKSGKVYKYGEFFPAEISPFCYNETVASDYFPLSKEEIENAGLNWKEKETSLYKITIKNEEIPTDIKDVSDQILSEVIECAHKGECKDRCTGAFKILQNELTFYKRFNIPIPHLCYWCRHFERFRKRRPLKLWRRQCMCDLINHEHIGKCVNEFETSYSSDREEKVFCEGCYQKEVI